MEVIISGASRGLGKTIAKELANKSNHLHLIARSEKDLLELKKELESNCAEISIYPTDLSVEKKIEKLEFSLMQKEIVLINNLGIYELDEPTLADENKLLDLLNVNLFSAIRLTKIILPKMNKEKYGRIINIGSIMSLQSSPIATSYSISKHALKAWTDALREELRINGILVSGIYPASINTSSWDGIEADRDSMIQTEDIAKLINTMIHLGKNTLVEEIRISPRDFNT